MYAWYWRERLKMQLVEKILAANSEGEMEGILREHLRSENYTVEQLRIMKESPAISRYLSLASRIDKQIEYLEFKTSNDRENSKSMLKRFLASIGLWY
jgi:hypothetical protein